MLVAAIAPVAYALTRISWFFGITVGTPDGFAEEIRSSGAYVGGLFIGLMALGGAVLMLGLVQRWGEVYPRWIWFAAGKRVPPPVAIIPATIIAIFLTSAGITELRGLLTVGVEADSWGVHGPGCCGRCGVSRWGRHLCLLPEKAGNLPALRTFSNIIHGLGRLEQGLPPLRSFLSEIFPVVSVRACWCRKQGPCPCAEEPS